mgnify:CR=1 FL=1
MQFCIDKNNVQDLLVGSSFYSCGGGVPVFKSRQVLASQIKDLHVPLRQISDFSRNSVFCTVYAIGASGANSKNYNKLVQAFSALEEVCETKFSGITPGEIGSEVNALWVASQKNVPLIDTDMVGGRAVPKDHMDIHGINNICPTPIVILNDTSNQFIIQKEPNNDSIESICRRIAINSNGYAYIAGRPINRDLIESLFPQKTISRSLLTGHLIRKAYTREELLRSMSSIENSNSLLIGTVTSVKLTHDPGFLSGKITIVSEDENKEYFVFFKNENIIIKHSHQTLCSVPDLITMLDLKNLLPLSNKDVKIGTKVMVMGIKALPQWRSQKAISLLQPSVFGFNEEYTPLKT